MSFIDTVNGVVSFPVFCEYRIFCFLVKFRNPLAQMEDEKRDHDAKLKKMETEMEQVFEMKVKEKKQKLKDSEIAVSSILFVLKVNLIFKYCFY